VAGGLALTAPAWALVQASGLTPAAWDHPAWRAVEAPGRIAAVPEAALTGALRLLAYGGAFLLAWHHGGSGDGAHRLLRGLVVAAGAYAAYGLAMLLGGADLLLWWDKWAYRGVFTATFVNRNAAAAFMALGGLAALTAVLRALRRADGTAAWRYGSIAGLCAAALLLTQSRAGLGAALGGLAVLSGGVVLARRPPWRRLRRGIAAAALGGLLLAALAGGGLVDRLSERGLSAADRALVHHAARAAVAERPWLGQGLGAFDLTFPAWRPEALRGHWDLAHGTSLELAYDLGLPVAMAWHLALLVVAAVCLSGLWRRRRRQEYPALGLAVLTVATVHGLVDFPFQMPANALWLAALLGMACAQSAPTGGRNRPLSAAASDRAAGSPARARR
jgi:O-antigen ligase